MFPYFKQTTKYTCGATSVKMILGSFGIKRSEKVLAKMLHITKRFGVLNRNIPPLLEKFRLNYAVLRHASIRDIKRFRKKGYQVMVCYYYAQESTFHYAVVRKVGHKYIYFWDPYLGPNHKYSRSYFKSIWKGTNIMVRKITG